MVNRIEQKRFEFSSPVDRDPQRLKRASGGDLRLFLYNCALDSICEVCRRRYRWHVRVVARFLEQFFASGSSAYSKMSWQFLLQKDDEQLCCGFTTRRVHAHVERRFVSETESAKAIQLQRRNTEISKNTAHLPTFAVARTGKFTKSACTGESASRIR